MSDTPRKPEPPPRLPTAESAPGGARREVVSTGVLLLFFLGLAAWHLGGDRSRTRPTELKREAVLRGLDLNRASKTELMQLPGVGPSLAEKILSHRKLNGPFRELDQLKDVPGVGEAVFARLSPHFVVGEAEDEPPDADPEPLLLARKKGPIVHTVQKPNLDDRTDINSAPLSELEKLPGIGPVLAKRIVEERERRPFARVEDLKRVNGIGPKKSEALRDRVRFGP